MEEEKSISPLEYLLKIAWTRVHAIDGCILFTIESDEAHSSTCPAQVRRVGT